MKHPSFSIIVPIYGVEKYIHRCATSLFRQDYDNIQYIFVNDGTKDHSMEILQSLIDQEYPHLKARIVIINKSNEGLPAARKTGMEYATGDYILHVDSDDYICTDAVSKIAQASERTDADLIYFDMAREFPKRTSYKKEKDYTGATKKEFISNMIKGTSDGYIWAKCFKKSVYDSHEIHYAPYCMYEDIFCSAQLIAHSHSIYHLEEYLYHYDCSNTSSILHNQTAERNLEGAYNLYLLYNLFLKNTDYNPDKEGWFFLCFRIGYHLMKAHHRNVNDYSEVLDYILSADFRFSDYGMIRVGRQIRIKAYFRRLIIKEKLSRMCTRIRKTFCR